MQEHFAPLRAKYTAPFPPDMQTAASAQSDTIHAAEQGKNVPVDDDGSPNGFTPRSIVASAQPDEANKDRNAADESKEGSNSKRSFWKNLKKLLLHSPRHRRKQKRACAETSGRPVETAPGDISLSTGDSLNRKQTISMPQTSNAEIGQQHICDNQETKGCRVIEQTSPLHMIGPSTEFGGGAFPKKVISNRGTFPWRRNMAPEVSIGKRQDVAKQGREIRNNQLNLTFVRERAWKKQEQRYLDTGEEDIGEVDRPRTRMLQNFKQRMQVPSFRSGRDTPQQTGKSHGNTENITAGLTRNAISAPSISAGELSLDSEEQTQSLRLPTLRTKYGRINQGSLPTSRLPKYSTLRRWGNNRRSHFTESDGLESPWGVKGEFSSGSGSVSRHPSRSFFDGIDSALLHVGDIVSAINQGLKAKKQAPRDSGLSDSQEGTVDQGGQVEGKAESDAVELLQDAFVEYTTRARQSSSKTFASMLRRKSAIL